MEHNFQTMTPIEKVMNESCPLNLKFRVSKDESDLWFQKIDLKCLNYKVVLDEKMCCIKSINSGINKYLLNLICLTMKFHCSDHANICAPFLPITFLESSTPIWFLGLKSDHFLYSVNSKRSRIKKKMHLYPEQLSPF